MVVRHPCLIAVLTLRCFAYELTGRIEPPSVVPIYLHGATAPFESSTENGADGRFRFHKISAGAYTLAISTAVSRQLLQTIEVGPRTVDAKGRLQIVLRIDETRLESEGARTTSATVSAAVLSIPDRAVREYNEAQRCLSRRESDRAAAHLSRAVQMAPQLSAAWNQLGVMAYQARRFSDAEANFRRALDADPEAFEPLVNLGGVLLNLNRPERASIQPTGCDAQAQQRSGELATRAHLLRPQRSGAGREAPADRRSAGSGAFLASTIGAGGNLSQARRSRLRRRSVARLSGAASGCARGRRRARGNRGVDAL